MRLTMKPDSMLTTMASLEEAKRDISGRAMSAPPMPVSPLMNAPMNQAAAVMRMSVSMAAPGKEVRQYCYACKGTL